ncbi:MetQ/NlpA family ABC transporter substrate-binding protein [Corticimicrobacter populi]|uniref:Lipoprotein n=1 Tax=Corticimicrobacter populi TaxID=2175229 RepID=A0A2V1JYQ5_9BURK|nr:MetQ/NlpA family ABC transporter substrate-binding protein [Corticimicrobacter populi]PWF21542.1 metal ABC transporter substrate-binding protein [Corticimicrobacter populi]QDQ88862.1 MetQ/NlpA family ABC transporter substrate-binding protein [Alcaligenaceae bacterium SJ-26]
MLSRFLSRLSGALLAVSLTVPALSQAETTIRVGQTSGPHAKIMEVVKQVAARDGLNIEIIEFGDYIQPNAALDAGDLDANNYQTQPFLQAQIQARGYKLTSVANTVLFPMGFYSKKYKSLDELPDGATVGIQNDPANAGRSLHLLQKYGLIKLREGAGLDAIPRDIAENPRNLKFHQVDAGQLPRSLDDLDIASINTSFAIKAGLVPKRDAIAIEDSDSPHTNLLVVRTEDQDKPWVAQLIKAYQSDEVRTFIETEFASFAIPSF